MVKNYKYIQYLQTNKSTLHMSNHCPEKLGNQKWLIWLNNEQTY